MSDGIFGDFCEGLQENYPEDYKKLVVLMDVDKELLESMYVHAYNMGQVDAYGTIRQQIKDAGGFEVTVQ